MCGRYFRRSDKQRLVEAFPGVKGLADLVLPPWDYNVAPTTFQPVIREDREGNHVVTVMRWGLVPYFAKDLKSFYYSTINARAETLTASAVFSSPFERRRCLIPADGFYEWKKLPAPPPPPGKPTPKKSAALKQPIAFTLAADHPFAFAGLWDRWKSPAGDPLESFTIITTTPNELTSTVHNRMPVILRPRDYALWLRHPPRDSHPSPRSTHAAQSAPPLELLSLLRPYPAELMQSTPAHPDVGNVRNNHPNLLNSA